MDILYIKSMKLSLLTSCVSVVVSGDFCRVKLALPSMLFLLTGTTVNDPESLSLLEIFDSYSLPDTEL